MLRAAIAVPYLLLTGCSWPAGDAPPSAHEPVELSVAGLTRLFEQECVQQRSAAWARQKYRNIADGCWPDDCRAKIEPSLSWTIPTADGSTVEVTLDWGGPFSDGMLPDNGPLNCSIAVPAKAEPLLRRVLAGVRAGGKPLVPAKDSGTAYFADQSWEWQNANPEAMGPRLLLIRYFPDEKTYRAAVASAGNDPDELGGYELGRVKRHMGHPWELRLDPIDIHRVPTRPCPHMANCVEIVSNGMDY